ncbi:class I SAM-dependent methyltransferase [Duganella sp. BJB488]|uniref:class I SAM-dependent methyltransferase n=1 Tax=unclassified Duganella TaxID=2636909 RepID=UPI000E34A058|nr:MULTISPECIES: SAM-dependent methyltransferase [unclassified Duganella]RFP24112.1 class I SAM-dependent methyltransferase [Duganella sp. BJB489]RFP26474.1 class I SAM-dependent methyltransferase [Duganella sp. BJB488]RFP34795.1 class I SAM-dependent methyltransferase [Duganella sp. BJB480]
MSLPVPTSDALAASHALQHLIAAEIARNDGAISFARYMELALYAPDLGYYSGGSAKLGKDGDFTTAPELTPLFGAAVAQAAAAIIAQSAPRILEFGAGTGKLAFDILTEMALAGVAIERYFIVELSGELRARQQDKLRDFPQVEWLDEFPDAFDGVVVGNEVLDAMPVQLITKHPEGWQELRVTVRDGRFDYLETPAGPELLAQIALQIQDHDSLPVGYVTEVHGVACGFMATLARMLRNGRANAAFLFDYGFPAHEYYLEQRATGTLMCHYRHHSHPDPFYYPGLQDITAHVDFTAMALAAQEAGADVLAYLNQAGFLIGAGAGELLLRTDPSDALRYLPQAKALQKLLSPAEMGELFKVLVIGKNVALPDAIAAHDRTHRL